MEAAGDEIAAAKGGHGSVSVRHDLSAGGVVLTPSGGDSPVRIQRLADAEPDLPDPETDVEYYKNLVLLIAGGVILFEIIDEADDPEQYQYSLHTGRDQSVEPDGDGGYVVVNKDGETVVVLAAPWAMDANGVEVPTSYSLEEDVLTLEIDHA